MSSKSLVFRWLLSAALVAPFVWSQSAIAAEKKILLRNATIDTSAPKRQGFRAAAADAPANGLFVLQLADNPPADWREQLSLLGVTLIKPVPHDAFVVQLVNASISRIEALPFIHWTGPYKPEYKAQSRIAALANEGQERRVRVTALLSPTASTLETALIQRRFAFLNRYSKSANGKILQGDISTKRLQALIDSQAVLWVEPTPEPKLFDALAGQIVAGEGENNGLYIHDLGFDGEGVSVAVADSGLNLGEGMPMHPDLEGRVDAFFYYGNLLDASDEHSHGTHVTGIIAGSGAGGETDESGYLYGLGIAPKAHIVAQRLFDGAGGYEAPDSMAQLTTDAVRAGADIGSNSWGDDTQGRYDVSAMEFDALVRDADPETPGDQPYILEFSAGNAGPGDRTIGSPAVAKNVIATGASQNERYDFLIYAGMESIADFSSRGPCDDGRIKPDIAAPGTWIASAQSEGASDVNAWMPISPLYQYQGGTSQAGPQVSGAAAVFVQYYRETHNGQTPSPALVKAALINSATDMDNSVSPVEGGTSFVPNMDEGWGRVDLTELIGSDRTFDFTDQTNLLANGQTFQKSLVLASGDLPLKITLAYTDVPGVPFTIPALVNDLDLEVISPSGNVYRGNQFLDGESVPNAPSHDSINNVEGVHISSPETGEYIVRIIARKVIEDSRRDTPAVIDQDFALVFSGDVPFPGQGVLSLDRRAYNAPSVMSIKLIDFDLRGQSSATVELTSSSQTTPLTISLQASGNVGVFTGAVQTAQLPLAPDGRLHIVHGDEISATYVDAFPAASIVARASADFMPPNILQVFATNRFSREVITWRTDEPASSIVRYGTNLNSLLSVTNAPMREDHSVTLGDLVSGQTYQYYIIAIDQAGNRSTNNNNGSNFSFVAQSAATVLLVDSYTYSSSEDRDDVEIPVTTYTDALDRTGISYEVWDTEVLGSPKIADLKPFRVVIWRINDSFYEPQSSINSGEQAVITEYLAGGGSFMVSSMDILTRIGPGSFRTNVLQVAGFSYRQFPLDDCPECDEDQGAFSIEGNELDSFTSGVLTELDYSNYPEFEILNIGPDLSDVFVPTTNATPIFFNQDGLVTGLRSPKTGSDSSGRVVLLGFPLDAIPLNGDPPNNRAVILRNLLAFLAPGVNGLGTLSLDNETYSAPAQMTVEVADSDMLEVGTVLVACRNVQSGESVSVQLKPTVRPGVFRGYVTLIPTNDVPGSAELRVADGDVIVAEYNDRSANGVVYASAEIDLGLPKISAVAAVADYENAQISWETDEFTDALVQFGESPLLGKTAYKSEMELEHTVSLAALLPDRIYYYRVVSRDEGGNTSINDNDGKLYTFRTLKPLPAPWTDSLESGMGGWTVQDNDESEASWELGRPNNDLDSEAHSGTNAWGTNLRGEARSWIMHSLLISPAVDLTKGNAAKLTFWHNYDFSTGATLVEEGALLLYTNTQTQPITLGSFADFTFGWERMEYDLSPYIGHIVLVVWEYASLVDISLESPAPPGWLVDDVELTVTTVSRGTVHITNNIAAAAFSVAGPNTFNGSGRSLIRTNSPVGNYVITFSPVPYYNTPPPQTNSVTVGATTVFRGDYTFADANSNGISDLWEQEQFNEVSPGRTSATDTDSDGFSDIGEFIGGTNPKDAASKLQVSTCEVLANNRVKLTWPSTTGKTYQLLVSSDGRTWQNVSGDVRATGAETSFTYAGNGSRVNFFRVQLIP